MGSNNGMMRVKEMIGALQASYGLHSFHKSRLKRDEEDKEGYAVAVLSMATGKTVHTYRYTQ
jgi:hypothetical protein